MGRREKDADRRRSSRVDMSRFLEGIGLKGGTDSADSDSYFSEASEGPDEDLEPREPSSRKAAGGGDKPKSVFKVGQKVRVWWEPTTDKNRTGFAGAYWPAKIIQKATNKCKVEYDNGDDEWALVEHISPDSPPVDFGKEKKPLEVGEFCEVHNGSKTDPCAWLGRIAKIHPNGDYQIEYPFHDAKPEKMPVERVRRARVNEAGKWRLIKPHQTWASGEVTSPVELETIDERNLAAVMAEVTAEDMSGGQAAEEDGSEEEEEEKPQRSSSRGKPPSRPASTVKKSSTKKKPKPESSSEEMDEEENDDTEDDSEDEPPSTSRGRGRKAATPPAVKRSGRQRKPSAKVRSAEGDDSGKESDEPEEQSESEEEPEEEEPKPKKTPKATPKSAAKSEEKPAPKRGRPAKNAKPEPKEEEGDDEEEEEPEPEEEKPKPKRSRPPASAAKEKAPAAAAKRKSSDAEDSAPKQPRGGRKRKAPQVRK